MYDKAFRTPFGYKFSRDDSIHWIINKEIIGNLKTHNDCKMNTNLVCKNFKYNFIKYVNHEN